MNAALGDYQVVGVTSNVAFLRCLVTSPSFVSARLDTGLIEREHDWLWPKQTTVVPDAAIVVAALSIILRERREAAQSGPAHSPWTIHDGWRLNAAYKRRFVFKQGERELAAIAEYRQNRYAISIGKANYSAIGELEENSRISAMIDGQRVLATAVRDRGRIHVFLDAKSYLLVYVDPLEIAAQGHSKESSLLAPMPGRVIAQMVRGRRSGRKGRAAAGAGSDEDGIYDSRAGSRPG